MSFVYLQRRIQENWGRILLVGGIYMALGLLAMTFSGVATFASVTFLGVLLAIVGISEIVFAFQTRQEGRFWYHLLFGALAVVCGSFIFISPIPNMMIITLVAASYLVAHGLVQMVVSVYDRYPYWGWSFAEGVIDLLLGGIILASWPVSSFWTIGLFVGISLLMYGAQLVGIAAMGRRTRKIAEAEARKPQAPRTTEPRRRPEDDKHDQDVQHFF